MKTFSICAVLLLGAGCGSDEDTRDTSITDPDDGEGDGNDDGEGSDELPVVFGGDRPVTLKVPSTYDGTEPTPILLVLHGYGANGAVQTAYTGLDRLVEERGMLLLAPEGNIDPTDRQFWNATPACCDFAQTGVDDVGYLSGLIEEVDAAYNVDRSRVFVFGHSNGGFMAHRLACERADLFTAIVSLAGAMHLDATQCAPSEPVSVLQVHGTLDDLIKFDGGNTCGADYCDFPGAQEAIRRWAGHDGCGEGFEEPDARLDLDSGLEGPETTITRAAGCPDPIDVELWSMVGGKHVPSLSPEFADALADWYADHTR